MRLTSKLAISLVLATTCLTALKAEPTAAPYSANWESLNKHTEVPEWFRDAKFGIYFHWGPYTVAEYGTEWYPRKIFFEGSPENIYHKQTFGDPKETGYHCLVPKFTAEKFDAKEWAALFKQAGAQFAGPVAEHHDGFSMWDSKLNPWNAKAMGPKRDVTGELEKAIRGEGMKFIATFHHERNCRRYTPEEVTKATAGVDLSKDNDTILNDSHFPPLAGYPTTSDDPQLRLLYGNMPEDEYLKLWFGKIKEVIDNYQPDMIWYDSWLYKIPEKNKQEFLAYYFNAAQKNNQDVIVSRKLTMLPDEVSIEDFEKGRAAELTEKPWLTDDTLSTGSWSYTKHLKLKPTKDIVHVLVDIISKNGQLLLNISPTKDGVIPDNQREILLGIGNWLSKYGEGVYGTRPFIAYGQGPTKMARGGHFLDKEGPIVYTPDDIRYTTKGNTVYAFQLGKGEAGKTLTLEAFKEFDKKIESISMIGNNEVIKWEKTDAGLVLTTPANSPDEMANAYKIQIAEK